MNVPSLKRDLATAVGFILLGAGPPVWAGSVLDVVRSTAEVGQSEKAVKLGGRAAGSRAAKGGAPTGSGFTLGVGDRAIAFNGGSHKVPGLGLRVDGELADALALDRGTPPRVLVVFPQSDGASRIAGEGTIADEMLQLAGGVNAFVGNRGYISPTPEAVRGAEPDVLLLTTYGLSVLGGETGLWSTPSLAQLDQETVQVVVMDDHLLLGFGTRAGAAPVAMASKPHGERAP